MKTKSRSSVVILVLDQHSGALRRDERAGRDEVLGADLFPATRRCVESLTHRKIPVTLLIPGVVGEKALRRMRDQIGDVEVAASEARPWKDVLAELTNANRHTSRDVVVVAADRVVRGVAREAGCMTFPHVLMACWHAEGQTVHAVLFEGSREELTGMPGLLPYRRERTSKGTWEVIAAASDAGMRALLDRRIRTTQLAVDIGQDDLYCVRLGDPRAGRAGTKRPVIAADRVVRGGTRDLLLAVGPRMRIDDLALHGAHGHFELLFPSPHHLDPAGFDGGAAATSLLRDRLPPELIAEVQVIPWKFWRLRGCPVSADGFQEIVDRYSGVTDADAAGPLASRHVDHPDNSRAVDALLAELRAIGYCAYTHDFSYGGRTLRNVIADLPGTGLFTLRGRLLEKLREYVLKHPWPDPPEALKKLLRSLHDEHRVLRSSQAGGRRKFVRDFEGLLKPWFPWWRRCFVWHGFGARVVIVGCHLDSTAAGSPGYDPATDAAPGHDDDASGMAATLSIARQFWALRGCLRHTVRFCFFNAEEQGLVGSKAYASMLRSFDAPLKAAICCDMIGFNSDAERIFEVHAGYTDPAIRDLNVPIAQLIADWAAALGRLAPAQIYKGTSSSGSTDRDIVDGAINRSDHAAFHQQGYPAVVVSEDFFANEPGEPGSDPNPNYHRATDTVIDSGYAADITCAVSKAVRDLARS